MAGVVGGAFMGWEVREVVASAFCCCGRLGEGRTRMVEGYCGVSACWISFQETDADVIPSCSCRDISGCWVSGRSEQVSCGG